MMAAKIKKGDKVVVLAGRDKGRNGEVLRVIPTEERAIVRGVNMVKRHTKQTARRPYTVMVRLLKFFSYSFLLRFELRSVDQSARFGLRCAAGTQSACACIRPMGCAELGHTRLPPPSCSAALLAWRRISRYRDD